MQLDVKNLQPIATEPAVPTSMRTTSAPAVDRRTRLSSLIAYVSVLARFMHPAAVVALANGVPHLDGHPGRIPVQEPNLPLSRRPGRPGSPKRRPGVDGGSTQM